MPCCRGPSSIRWSHRPSWKGLNRTNTGSNPGLSGLSLLSHLGRKARGPCQAISQRAELSVSPDSFQQFHSSLIPHNALVPNPPQLYLLSKTVQPPLGLYLQGVAFSIIQQSVVRTT